MWMAYGREFSYNTSHSLPPSLTNAAATTAPSVSLLGTLFFKHNLETSYKGEGGTVYEVMERYTTSKIFLNVYNILRRRNFGEKILKNGVFWDLTPCGSCRNRLFRET
jgi:hypothetical protein